MPEQSLAILLGWLDPFLQLGLATVMHSDPRVELLGEAHDVTCAREILSRREAHAFVVGEAIGHAVLGRLKADYPTAAIVVSVRERAELYSELLAAEGATCLPQDATIDELLRACLVQRLTPRLREVYTLLSEKHSHHTIASQLELSVRTVNGYAAAIRAVFDEHGVPLNIGRARPTRVVSETASQAVR